MEIVVKSRHTEVNDRFREQAASKLTKKIAKLDHKVMRVDVEVSAEHNPRQADRRERVQLTIRSRGPVIRAEAAAEDRFVALDLALGKLESRLRKQNDRRKVHHGNHAPAKLGTAATANGTLGSPDSGDRDGGTSAGPDARGAGVPRSATRLVPSPAVAGPAGDGEAIVPISMEGDGPLVVREKCHYAKPMSIDQALHEMELVGHDFYLFRDDRDGHPCVVYRRRGWDYGLIRLMDE
jgi:ribosomal subunit interface protein